MGEEEGFRTWAEGRRLNGSEQRLNGGVREDEKRRRGTTAESVGVGLWRPCGVVWCGSDNVECVPAAYV